MAIANDSSYGLCGSVWTNDPERGLEVARGVRTGTYMLNSPIPIDFSTPFGGYKESGMGREFGPDGLELFLEKKSINLPAGFSPRSDPVVGATARRPSVSQPGPTGPGWRVRAQ